MMEIFSPVRHDFGFTQISTTSSCVDQSALITRLHLVYSKQDPSLVTTLVTTKRDVVALASDKKRGRPEHFEYPIEVKTMDKIQALLNARGGIIEVQIISNSMDNLDPTDQGILYLLQQDARNNTTAGIGEKVGVSSTTVGNRINNLEDRGIITGYQPTIDYEKAGLDHHMTITATVPMDDRSRLAEKALNVHGVVTVRELLAHHQNLEIEIATSTRNEIEESLDELATLGLDIVRNELLKREIHQSADNFGKNVIDE